MHKVSLKLSSQLSEAEACQLTEGLITIALSSATMRKEEAQNAHWIIEWIFSDKPKLSDIIARLSLQSAAYNIGNLGEITPNNLKIQKIPDNINWPEKSYNGFVPFSISTFFIYGSDYKGKIPKQQISLKLDAATAFGSGEHETTRGCILGMLDLKDKGICPCNILDMGTGSGILALIAWKLWENPVLGVDNQKESIRVANIHAKMNNVRLHSTCLSTAIGDGFHTPKVNKNKPYELILANILAGSVIEMAPSLTNVLDNGGYCILSGMLNQQKNFVLSAYEGTGLTYCTHYELGEWTTLVLQKNN